jgi:hypothetical protein
VLERSKEASGGFWLSEELYGIRTLPWELRTGNRASTPLTLGARPGSEHRRRTLLRVSDGRPSLIPQATKDPGSCRRGWEQNPTTSPSVAIGFRPGSQARACETLHPGDLSRSSGLELFQEDPALKDRSADPRLGLGCFFTTESQRRSG